MGDEKCREQFLKVVQGVTRLQQRKARAEEARKNKSVRRHTAESLDLEESPVEVPMVEDEEACRQALIEEIEKIGREEQQVAKERKQIKDEIENEMVRMTGLKSRLFELELEIPEHRFWERQIRSYASEVLQGLKDMTINIQQCKERVFPIINQELQEVSDAQGNYLKFLLLENSKLKSQLKDLMEKEEKLETEIAVLESEEMLLLEAEKEVGMQVTYNLGQINNRKLLEQFAENKRESLQSQLRDLVEKGREVHNKIRKLTKTTTNKE
ncbi:uncharacterized protein PF3D7_1120000-like isoform X2 [Palaemon carinicauda]